MGIRTVLIGLLIAAVGGAALAAEPALSVIELSHRPAEEVLPIIRPLLGGGESASGDGYRVFLRASDKTRQEIERVVKELDVARRVLRISVRHTSARTTGRTAHELSGRVSTKESAAGTAGRPGDHVEYRIERRTASRDDGQTHYLNVLDGAHGVIQVGQSVPQLQPFLALAGDRLLVAAHIQYFDVTTGFDVLPMVRGEHVRLQITPRLSFLSNQGTQVVTFQELTTAVDVKFGEWVDLGGILDTRHEVNRAILAGRRSQSEEHHQIQVRVE